MKAALFQSFLVRFDQGKAPDLAEKATLVDLGEFLILQARPDDLIIMQVVPYRPGTWRMYKPLWGA